MPTNPLPPPLEVLTTEQVILRALANGESFRSVDGAFAVDFYSDHFVVSSGPRKHQGPFCVLTFVDASVFDEEEFSIAFSDTVWEPVRPKS